ncbi:MAG: RHS repeat-associated core domain-containing protein [Candidatus Microbacterium phytovorans]|uniref:RHS repeat-associated core domain-containing protein n=1 Tax=Candidatus Microbacterium phytovorans TaxID=3121374 RepID=A0AAJ5VZE0_9MICO|nr:RHS repeat-associated core domain-containing protein [Microbacterium sp.]WEK13211.1 MAG: RHS repeat-associated core domain-containing protein [Microbacterium sp.]
MSATRWYSFAGKLVAHRTGNGLSGVSSVVTDPQGSVVGTVHNTDWASGVVWKRPDPFGGARSSTSVTSAGRGFLGAVHDSNALVLLGARYFDPAAGVFVSVDPLLDPGNPAQFNAYVYAGNNPVTWSDPSGLAWTGPVADGGDHRYVAKDKTSSRAGVGNPRTPSDSERTCSRGRVPVCASKATAAQTVTVAHLVLSVVGLFHEAGDIADGALSLAEGDLVGAGVSAGAAAPLAGIAAGFSKIGKYWDKLFGARRGAEAAESLSGTQRLTLEDALRPDKLDHVFHPKHNFGPLIEKYGSKEAALEQIVRSMDGSLPTSGKFEITRQIGDQTVIIRGAVVDGIPRIGTAFTP